MSYFDKPLPIKKLTFEPSLRNISKPDYETAIRYNVLKKYFYNKIRKVDIDIILGKPTWVDNIKDTFKNLHTTSIVQKLWGLSSNSTYGVGWMGTGYSYASAAHLLHTENLSELLEKRRATDLRIKNYLHNRPSGIFIMKHDAIYPGLKYNGVVEDYGNIRDISDYEDEGMTIKNL